jgi:hypothetical protein
MIGERITNPHNVLRVTPPSDFGGVPVPAGCRLEGAEDSLAAATGMLLPRGDYLKIAENAVIAIYEPVRFDTVWSARIWWACYKADLHSRADLYSREMPINVGSQDGRSLTFHHDAPASDALLWCYMKTNKFVSMLQNGGIQLTRADLFCDKEEGTLRPHNLLYRRGVYADDATMANAGDVCVREFRRMKRHTSISCWRIDTDEDQRSWHTYVGKAPGVAIVTTYGQLAQRLAYYFCATVEYLDDGWIPEGNSLYPFIHKRRSFEWEREFRIIHQRFPRTQPRFRGAPFYDCGQPNPAPRLTIKMNLNAIIHTVVTGPKTTNAQRTALRTLIRPYRLSATF